MHVLATSVLWCVLYEAGMRCMCRSTVRGVVEATGLVAYQQTNRFWGQCSKVLAKI